MTQLLEFLELITEAVDNGDEADIIISIWTFVKRFRLIKDF